MDRQRGLLSLHSDRANDISAEMLLEFDLHNRLCSLALRGLIEMIPDAGASCHAAIHGDQASFEFSESPVVQLNCQRGRQLSLLTSDQQESLSDGHRLSSR